MDPCIHVMSVLHLKTGLLNPRSDKDGASYINSCLVAACSLEVSGCTAKVKACAESKRSWEPSVEEPTLLATPALGCTGMHWI